jgi:putative acetyltransferase
MNLKEIVIREANESDFNAVMEVEKLAFCEDGEANLVCDLLSDKSAEPILSLLAFYKNKAIGHILFTKALIENNDSNLIHLLAPLAVLPEFQRMGIGGLLINGGLEMLKEKGSELVFVLGHKAYYPKYGFIPDAKKLGFLAPYPIPEKDADAWMVQSLTEDGLKKLSGKIMVADKLMKPEYWRE